MNRIEANKKHTDSVYKIIDFFNDVLGTTVENTGDVKKDQDRMQLEVTKAFGDTKIKVDINELFTQSEQTRIKKMLSEGQILDDEN